MNPLALALRSLARNPRRSIPAVVGLALAVGLFSGILFFVDASARTLTDQTVAPVNVDLQANLVTASADPVAVRRQLAAQPGITGAEILVAADFPSASAASTGLTTTTPGRLFALEPSYFATFPRMFRVVGGTLDPSGALISEALASQLGLHVGDTAQAAFPGRAAPFTFRVSGVVDATGADVLFSLPGDQSGETSPVANLILVDMSRYQAELAADLQRGAPTATAAPAAGAVPGALPKLAVQPEVDLRVDRAGLPSDPGHALDATNVLRRRAEKAFPGDVRVVNNLADVLTAARKDVLDGKILFLFLGIPGVLVAAMVSAYASRRLTEAQRRDLALLRARGASPRRLGALLALQALLVSMAGMVIGLGLGAGVTVANFGRHAFDGAGAIVRVSVIASAVAGLVLGALAAVLPLRSVLREAIGAGRREVRSSRPPAWQRLYLDVVALAGAALVLWAVSRSGLGSAANSESASLTLSWFGLLAPLLVWVGCALILVRVSKALLGRLGGRRAGGLRFLAGPVGPVAGRSLARRSAQVSATVVVVSLAVAFGASLAVFASTYTARRNADAAFALGADVKITPSQTNQQTAAFVDRLRVPGVTDATAVKSTTIFVGSEPQTGYGIDPAAFERITRPPDRLFSGTTAAQALGDLGRTPDGAIVSADLAKAYDVRVGDVITTRVLDHATKSYVDTKLRTVAVASNWPSSPVAGFLVTNLSHLTAVARDDQIDFFLASAPANPHAAALAVRAGPGRGLSLKIEDSATALRTEASSLTTLSLSGLSRLEFAFSVAVAGLGLLVFLLAAVAERARELGAIRALGSTPGQLRRLLWTEHGIVGLLAIAIGTVTGLALARTFVGVLKSIFTAAPSGLVVPWGRLALLDGAAGVGILVAGAAAALALTRIRAAEILRDR